ncbi:MAG: hypothetical protein F4Y16_15345 [Holophagales bacterium]|nr:hypothetical protein [Holophagales bacterium]MYH24217.1 hypothetical protein [Holophagales bacterium]
MKIPVSTALVIALGAGLVFGGSAHSLAAAPFDEPPEAAEALERLGELISDDDLEAVVGALSGRDVAEAACVIIAGGAGARKLVHVIARRAVFGVCGLVCGIGGLAAAAACAIYF